MPVSRLVFGVCFNFIDCQFCCGLTHLESRHLNRRHGCLEHAADTMSGEAHDLDLVRDFQPSLSDGTDGAEPLYFHCGDDRVQVWVFVQKLNGSIIAIAEAVDNPVRTPRDFFQTQFLDGFPISLIAAPIRGKMLSTGNQADGTATFFILRRESVLVLCCFLWYILLNEGSLR